MTLDTQPECPEESAVRRRFAWWPAALLVLMVFGLSLAAWAVFFRLGSTIDTHRLEPTEVPALIEKHEIQKAPPAH